MELKAQALQKPLRLGHSHASMAAAIALHGFTGRRLSPAVRVRGWFDRLTNLFRDYQPVETGARGTPPPQYSKIAPNASKQPIVIF